MLFPISDCRRVSPQKGHAQAGHHASRWRCTDVRERHEVSRIDYGVTSPNSSNPSNSSPSSNGSSPGSSCGGPGVNNGPWGSIRTDYGAYLPGTIDYTAEPTGQQTVTVLPGTCDALEGRLAGHADDIEAAQIPYNPLGSNSNSTARELLERAGLLEVRPVVWAPGWDTQLPGPPN